jgi:protein tyrosine phosphatase
MLCNESENGKQNKNIIYFPRTLNEPMAIPSLEENNYIEVSLIREEIIKEHNLLKREFNIKYKEIEKILTHLHVLSWSDYSSPDETGYEVLNYCINEVNYFSNEYNKPIIVHCR